MLHSIHIHCLFYYTNLHSPADTFACSQNVYFPRSMTINYNHYLMMITNFEHNDVQSGWTGLLSCILVSERCYDLTHLPSRGSYTPHPSLAGEFRTGERGLREPMLAVQAFSGSDEPMHLDKSPVRCTGPGVSNPGPTSHSSLDNLVPALQGRYDPSVGQTVGSDLLDLRLPPGPSIQRPIGYHPVVRCPWAGGCVPSPHAAFRHFLSRGQALAVPVVSYKVVALLSGRVVACSIPSSGRAGLDSMGVRVLNFPPVPPRQLDGISPGLRASMGISVPRASAYFEEDRGLRLGVSELP